MDLAKIKTLVKEGQVTAIDLRYSGLDGRWYHITFPIRRLEYVIENGVSFDGSSIPGMRAVESGDMVVKPDLATAMIEDLDGKNIIVMLGTICDALTGIGVAKDPRSVALRAHEYMKSTGIADESFWIPELEYYIFDEVIFKNTKYEAGYTLSSCQNRECLPDGYEDPLATSQQDRSAYHMGTPFDRYFKIRQQAVAEMEKLGIQIRYHHGEGGISGQQEIETDPSIFPKICDELLLMKDLVRKAAYEHDCTVTFMPKPIYNEAGSGMHYHILLKNKGKNVFWKKGGYADLSDEALYFIGGILMHGASLTALTNPSTNSFKRLLPGFQAPVKLFYGRANRSAAIRIPNYLHLESNKRIEFRTGDATANPYLAMSALLMAGLDGVINKIHPDKHGFGPVDENVFNWPKAKQNKLKSIPTNLEDALIALQKDNEYLLKGGVFSKELLNSWIELKTKDVDAINHRPHPYEMNLYYNL